MRSIWSIYALSIWMYAFTRRIICVSLDICASDLDICIYSTLSSASRPLSSSLPRMFASYTAFSTLFALTTPSPSRLQPIQHVHRPRIPHKLRTIPITRRTHIRRPFIIRTRRVEDDPVRCHWGSGKGAGVGGEGCGGGVDGAYSRGGGVSALLFSL